MARTAHCCRALTALPRRCCRASAIAAATTWCAVGQARSRAATASTSSQARVPSPMENSTVVARAPAAGELFSDEGSAYWIAREALTLFSRMSDGRAPKSALYDLIRERFQLQADLDVCAAVYGPPPFSRSEIAALAPLAARAARAGDAAAHRLFERAAEELAAVVHAVLDQLDVPPQTPLPVSYSGGMFRLDGVLTPLFETALKSGDRRYEFVAPRLPPSAGAALYAAKLAGAALNPKFVAGLARAFDGRERDSDA